MKQKTNGKTVIGFSLLVVLVLIVAYFFYPVAKDYSSQSGQESQQEQIKQEKSHVAERVMIGVAKPLEPSDIAYVYEEASGKLIKVDQPDGWRVGDIIKQPDFSFVTDPVNPEVMRFILGDAWNIALKDEKGNPYQNPSFVGLLNEDTAVLIAEEDGWKVLLVKSNGKILEAYELPALYKIHGVFGNAVWISTALSGEGIESEPQGPTHIIRVNSKGAESLMTEDEVIQDLVASHSNAYAYSFANGSYKARRGNFLWEGNGRPLLWLNDDELLISQGRKLKKVRLVESSQDTIGKIDGVATRAGRIQFVSQ